MTSPKSTDQTPSPGGGTPDTGCGTPFRLKVG